MERRSYAKRVNWKNPAIINIVKQEVQLSPENLTMAFANAAKRINTTRDCVSRQWYNVLNKKIKGFTITSKNKKVVNSKNIIAKPVAPKQSIVPIYETIISTKVVEGMRIVTTKQYFID